MIDNQGVNMRQYLLQNSISYLVGFFADEQVWEGVTWTSATVDCVAIFPFPVAAFTELEREPPPMALDEILQRPVGKEVRDGVFSLQCEPYRRVTVFRGDVWSSSWRFYPDGEGNPPHDLFCGKIPFLAEDSLHHMSFRWSQNLVLWSGKILKVADKVANTEGNPRLSSTAFYHEPIFVWHCMNPEIEELVQIPVFIEVKKTNPILGMRAERRRNDAVQEQHELVR